MFHTTDPGHDLKVKGISEAIKGRVNRDGLLCSDLKCGKYHEAKELDCHGKNILDACTTSVVTVANSGDDRTDPIVGEDNEIYDAHAPEIFISQGPGHVAYLMIDEAFTSDINVQTAKVVKEDHDLAKRWHGKNKNFGMMGALNYRQVL